MRKTCCPLQRILNSSVLTCVVLMCFAPIASIFNLQPPGNRIPAQILVLFVISFKKPVQKQMPALLAFVFVPRFFYFLASFGLFAPYLERACLLFATPAVSSVPRTMWYLVPGRSFTRPPRIRTTLCSCRLCPSPGM